MRQYNEPSDERGKPSIFRRWQSALLIAILFALPFFQPGLLFVSMLAAFILGARKHKGSRFLAGSLTSFSYAGIYVLICIFVLPFLHEYSVLSWHWVLVWGSALAAIGISTVAYFQAGRHEWTPKKKVAVHSATWLSAASLAFFAFVSASNQDVLEWSMAEALSPTTMSRLPNSDLPNFRLLPLARARDFLRTTNDDSTLKVSMPNMTACNTDGKPCWQADFHLKGRAEGIHYNLLFDTVFDVASVDPTDINKKSQKTEGLDGFFLAGPNSWVVQAAFAVHNPFSTQEEALYWKNNDGTMVMLIPYVSERPTLTGVMVPYLAGVMSVNRFGIVNDMSPGTAKEKYPGVPFYPTRLARQYAEIYAKWHGGIWGRTVSKRDELRVSEPESKNNPHFNQAPYVEVYEEIGWQEVIALEPNADDSRALASLLFFDAATGYCRQYVVPSESTISGPSQASGNVKQGNWQADWSGHMKVEPRPLIRNGHIFYVVGILDTVGNEHPYVSSIVIDAKDMKPYPVLNHQNLVSLLEKLEKGIEVQPITPSPAAAASTKETLQIGS
ncbi:MAG: hypothetical protein K2Y39_14785 [Candidatus Obscuribacterales bacterium]|nr:hypothetical protein [Candidatus Obscuribacterales bacterium]